MAKVLEAVQRYRAIENATSSTDEVPPVYIMDELAQLSNSSADQADAIADHISKRLSNKSPVVKWKALRLIRHMCNKGCYRFQKNMQAHAASVRELVSYKGEKDPFKGDSLNQRVRDIAKEVVETLYISGQAHGGPAVTAMKGTGRMQGFGSSTGHSAGGSTSPGPQSYNAPPSATSSESYQYGRSSGGGSHGSGFPGSGGASSRMVGFGSDGRSAQPQVSGPTGSDLSSTVSSAVGNLGGFVMSQFSANAREQASALHQRTGSHDDGSGYADFGSRAAQPSVFGTGRVQGSFGPSGSTNRGGGGPPAFSSTVAPVADAVAASSGFRGGPASALGSEESLVGNICAPGGMRAAPDAEDLRTFVEAAGSMDGLRIGELLIQKMNSSNHQILLRSLYALEAVLQLGSSQACGEVAVMFQSDPGPVVRASASPQAAVKERAARCLKQLLGDEYHVQALAAPRSQVAPQSCTPQLLDLLGDDMAPAPAHTSDRGKPPADFLGALTGIPAEASSSFPALAASSVPAQQQQEGLDPFGMGDIFNASTAAPVPAVSSQQQMLGAAPDVSSAATVGLLGALPAAIGRPPLDDFFSSMDLGSTSGPGKPAVSAGMIGGMHQQAAQPQYPQQQHQLPQRFQQGPPAAGSSMTPGTAYAPAGLGAAGDPFFNSVGPSVGGYQSAGGWAQAGGVGGMHPGGVNSFLASGGKERQYGTGNMMPASAASGGAFAMGMAGPTAAAGAGTASWAPLLATAGHPQQQQFQQQQHQFGQPQKSIGDSNMFDFVKDHLK